MRSRKTNPVVALVLFSLFSGAIVMLAGFQLYLDEQFDHGALISQGSVQRCWTTTGSKGGIHYHVSYLFRDRYFRQWTVSTAIAQSTYSRLHVGEVVPVKYLDDETGRSRIDWPDESQYHWHQDVILLAIGLVIAVISLLIFIPKLTR